MIHGKTKIELYNPNTKIKNVIKNENTFQSGVLAKQLNPFGEFGLPNLYNFSNSVGGILLFRDAITIGKEFMPAGNKMIGHGYRGSVTQGNYPYLGTFNSSESSASASAITQVYDFATNQANGTIGCVSLTSLKGGQIGYGFNGEKYASLEIADYGNSIGVDGSQSGYYNGYRYRVSDYSEGILTIEKMAVDVEKGNIFRGFTKNLTFDMSEVGNHFNSPLNYYWIMLGDCGNGIFRFCHASEGNSGKSVASGGTIYYYEFDAVNETLEEKSFTNSSNDTLSLGNYGVQFRGNYCFIVNVSSSSTATLYIFDVANSLLVRKINDVGNFARYEGTFAPPRVPCELSDDLFLIQTDTYTFMYDAIADETQMMNLAINNQNLAGQGRMTQMRSLGGVLKAFSRNDGYNRVGKNPLYLATINNLQSPVTKTAAQTMKVTYTLTEA